MNNGCGPPYQPFQITALPNAVSPPSRGYPRPQMGKMVASFCGKMSDGGTAAGHLHDKWQRRLGGRVSEAAWKAIISFLFRLGNHFHARIVAHSFIRLFMHSFEAPHGHEHLSNRGSIYGNNLFLPLQYIESVSSDSHLTLFSEFANKPPKIGGRGKDLRCLGTGGNPSHTPCIRHLIPQKRDFRPSQAPD